MRASSHVVEDQSQAIAFLADPRTHGGADIRRIDTHGAIVVLAGDRAYKLKRAVRFPYMDFSTGELRKRACEAELRLNRRTAPGLYLGIAPITREASAGLSIGGKGETVDWLVVMRRFDEHQLFDRLAERNGLAPSMMTALTDEILRFHAAAEPRLDQGGAEGIARVIAGNDAGLREADAAVVAPARAARLRKECEVWLDHVRALLDARRASGLVRHCHGDLHLRNICLIDGRPTLFDAIEFNDQISCIDVLYDLAFLLMDLDHRGFRTLGNLVLNRYLSEGATMGGLGDLAALAALPLFLACRAAVRAQVSIAAVGTQPDPAVSGVLLAEVGRYVDLAFDYLVPTKPALIAVGGLSGSGKSTLAQALAPFVGSAPGAIVLRSDVIRKQLAGVDTLSPLPASAYSRETTARVYEAIRARAREALLAGRAVIADAVHADIAERAAIETVARDLDVDFEGLWLDAPATLMTSRIATRRDDPSDATVAVLQCQLDYALGPITWHMIDASGAPEAALARSREALHLLGACAD